MKAVFGAAGLGAAIMMTAAAPAASAQGTPTRSVGGSAKDAVTQPLQDLNLAGRKVPTELLLLQQDPYATEGLDTCPEIDE